MTRQVTFALAGTAAKEGTMSISGVCSGVYGSRCEDCMMETCEHECHKYQRFDSLSAVWVVADNHEATDAGELES